MQAIGAYGAALQTDPHSPEALSALDRLYRRHEMWENLIDVLERKADATSDPDEQVKIRLEVGRLWDERLNEPGHAIEAYAKVRDLEPRSMSALRSLERLYENTGQTEAYLDVLEQQLDAAPTDAEKISLYKRMASAWEEQFGKLDRSAEALEKILAIDERNMPSYRELERLYRQEKKWDSLVDTIRRHILSAADQQTRIDLYCAMGQVYEEELKDFDRAIEAYNDMLTFDPDDARALEALGRLYEKIEEWDEVDRLPHPAGGHLARRAPPRRAAPADRPHPEERMDDQPSAETHFLEALSLDGTHVPTMPSLTGLYKKRGDWLKAAQMMVRAEPFTPTRWRRSRLLYEAAQIYEKRLGDPAKARSCTPRRSSSIPSTSRPASRWRSSTSARSAGPSSSRSSTCWCARPSS